MKTSYYYFRKRLTVSGYIWCVFVSIVTLQTGQWTINFCVFFFSFEARFIVIYSEVICHFGKFYWNRNCNSRGAKAVRQLDSFAGGWLRSCECEATIKWTKFWILAAFTYLDVTNAQAQVLIFSIRHCSNFRIKVFVDLLYKPHTPTSHTHTSHAHKKNSYENAFTGLQLMMSQIQYFNYSNSEVPLISTSDDSLERAHFWLSYTVWRNEIDR